MKKLVYLLTVIASLPTKCKAQSNTAVRYEKTSTIVLQASVERVFPLFGAYEEKKWAEGWDPLPIYPVTGEFGEGTLFRTKGHSNSAPNALWIVSRYDTTSHIVQYTIPDADRILTIHITCEPSSNHETKATVSYVIISLTNTGKISAEHILHRIFSKNLEDWSTAINTYLRKY